MSNLSQYTMAQHNDKHTFIYRICTVLNSSNTLDYVLTTVIQILDNERIYYDEVNILQQF